MKKYSFIFLIILSTLLSSCSAINEFLAELEVRDAKKISHYAPVVYQRPYEETVFLRALFEIGGNIGVFFYNPAALPQASPSNPGDRCGAGR